jgi:hypothetical protein
MVMIITIYASPTTRAAFLALALLSASLMAVPAALAASNTCDTAEEILLVGTTVGQMDGNERYWYRHSTLGDASYTLTYSNPQATMILQVWDGCGGNALCSEVVVDTGTCMTDGAGTYYIEIQAYYAPVTYQFDYNGLRSSSPTPDVPVHVPGDSASQNVPGTTTPNVPPQSFPGSPIEASTCPVSVCTDGVTVPAQSTPPVGQVCAPLGIVCVGPVPSQPLTPPVPVAPVCTTASFLCIGPLTLVPADAITTPGLPPTQATPPVTVSVTSTGFSGAIEPNAGEFTSFGPSTVMVGPVPVILCATPCPIPVLPGTPMSGAVTVTVIIGSETYVETVPITL